MYSNLVFFLKQNKSGYDPSAFRDLPVSPEIKDIFKFIERYQPQAIELEFKLKPFIPEYIPCIGDIDAFIKIPRPDAKPDTFGLTVLDEPSGKQSDQHVLDLQLRTLSKQTSINKAAVRFFWRCSLALFVALLLLLVLKGC